MIKETLLKYLDPMFICFIIFILVVAVLANKSVQNNSKGRIDCESPIDLSCYFNSLTEKGVIYQIVCTDDTIYYVPIDKCKVELYNTKD